MYWNMLLLLNYIENIKIISIYGIEKKILHENMN